MEKIVYFVRHGESTTNTGETGLGTDSELTEKGKVQAETLKKRFSTIEFDSVISSDLRRAKETAQIINDGKNPLHTSALFRERRHSSTFVGKFRNDESVARAEQAMWEQFGPGIRHDDEENFDDQYERAQKALQYLLKQQEKRILVSTHGIFLRMLIATALFPRNLNGETYAPFVKQLRTKNTG